MGRIVGIVIGIIFIGYYFVVNNIEGKTTFTGFYLYSGIGIIIYAGIIDKLMKFKLLNKMYFQFKILFLIGMIIVILIEGVIILYPKKEIARCDYLIILGSGLRGDKITLTLKDRLVKALEYIEKSNFNGKIVLSGGQGPYESITEAYAMKKFLVGEGISEDRILLEEKSTSTYENLKFSKPILENESGKSVKNLKFVIVTTDFHAMRSAFLAKRNGYGKVSLYTSSNKWYLMPTMYIREVFALVKSFIFDRT